MVAITQAVKSVIHRISDNNPKAIYKITVNDTDISTVLNTRLISMSIEDHRGLESDSISIELSDHDGKLNIPPKGAELKAWIGWESTGLVYKGKFIVKELEHSGSPDTLHIRATSADLKKSFKKKKERSFNKKTIEQIVTQIAYEQNLIPSVHNSLALIELAHIDQNESDANLITRIADEYDAIATVKHGILLFIPKGLSQTAKGTDLPTAEIHRIDGDKHRYSLSSGHDEISGVTCFYYDEKKAQKQKVTVGDTDEHTKELRNFCRDQRTALHMARSQFNKLKRKAATFSISLAYGMPELIPETELAFFGWKTEITDVVWLGTHITHELDGSNGFTTHIHAEVKMPDSDDIAQLIDDKGGTYTGIVAYYKDGVSTSKITRGDQKSPKRLTFLYKNKATATTAADREWKALKDEQAKKNRLT
ncbi:contractile injection system protein, VgrG/Pvc8 family [Acinetobacter nectaris]|uniref:contractile injection system protein, VgrG/Pvc8 family n=1 Tax=Acinetobacter nectaris TaxID=1219382 RepID=UPI001F3465F9|nr:contractile injection system protein, VgrG/Pvc8 family [Acinetobacter nectaris]MCF9034702.1 DNA primase [Acinetobacter nectaris]